MLPRGPEQLKMYELAAELDPTHRGAWMNLANAHLSAGRVEEQLKALRWLAKIDPVEGRSRLTNALTLQERSLEVAALWRRAADAGAPPSADAVGNKVEAAAAGAEVPEVPGAPLHRGLRGGGAAASGAGRARHVGRRRARDGRRHALIGGGAAARGGPTLLAGGARGWPPTLKWDAAYMQTAAGDEELDVTIVQRAGDFEVRHDRIERPPKSTMRLGDFVRLLSLKADANLTVYSRQAPLWPMAGLLVDLAPLAWMEPLKINDLNVWLGDGHFRNTLHFDPYDNFLCQVRGSKHLLLWPPDQKGNLYYNNRRDIQAKFTPSQGEYQRRDTGIVSSNTASINGAAPDLAAFPRFAEARAAQSYAHIGAGDCLFLPRSWHHHVFSEADAVTGYNLALNLWIDRDATVTGGGGGGSGGDASGALAAGAAGVSQQRHAPPRFPTLRQIHEALLAGTTPESVEGSCATDDG